MSNNDPISLGNAVHGLVESGRRIQEHRARVNGTCLCGEYFLSGEHPGITARDGGLHTQTGCKHNLLVNPNAVPRVAFPAPVEMEKRAQPNRKVNCSICGASGERWELYYDPVDDSFACVDLGDCHR